MISCCTSSRDDVCTFNVVGPVSLTLRSRCWSSRASFIKRRCVPAAEPESYTASERTKVKRLKDRGTYDRQIVHAILDEAFIAHVGFVKDGYPLVLPMGYARDGENLLLHGSITNAMLKNMKVSKHLNLLLLAMPSHCSIFSPTKSQSYGCD